MIKLFFSMFLLVGAKAFQQLNVIGGHYRLIMASSFFIAVSEVVIVLEVVALSSYWAALPMGLGGGLGAMLSMYMHRRYVK